MSGQVRIWTGEKKARRNKAETENRYNQHVSYLQSLHAQHSSMLGGLSNMGKYLDSIGSNAKKYENILQNLSYQGREHEKEKSKLDEYGSNLASGRQNIENRELGLFSEFDKYRKKEENFKSGSLELTKKKLALEEAFKGFSKKAPELSKLIEEYHKLPDEVNSINQELASHKE